MVNSDNRFAVLSIPNNAPNELYYYNKDFIDIAGTSEINIDYEKKILLAIKSVLDDIKASIVVGVESSRQLKTIYKMFKLKKDKYLMADIYKSRKLWSALPKNSIDDTLSTGEFGTVTGAKPSLVYLKQNILSESI